MKKSEDKKELRRRCPYCDDEIALNPFPYCKPCHVELQYCLKCNIVVEKTAKVCPQCGQSLE